MNTRLQVEHPVTELITGRVGGLQFRIQLMMCVAIYICSRGGPSEMAAAGGCRLLTAVKPRADSCPKQRLRYRGQDICRESLAGLLASHWSHSAHADPISPDVMFCILPFLGSINRNCCVVESHPRSRKKCRGRWEWILVSRRAARWAPSTTRCSQSWLCVEKIDLPRSLYLSSLFATSRLITFELFRISLYFEYCHTCIGIRDTSC